VIGTKVRALADRGTVRDLIDVQAASRDRSTAELESLGRRRAHDEFSLEAGCSGSRATNWPQSGSVSHDGSAGTGLLSDHGAS
jgi:hypothetical protein